MNCHERQDLLLLYAAGALEDRDAEAQELRAHLSSGCPVCAAALVEAEAAVAHLPLALPPASPGPDIREKLLARIAELPRTQPLPAVSTAASPAQSATSKSATSNWLAPAVSAALAASLAAIGVYLWLENSLGNTGRELAQLKSEVGALQRSVSERDAQLQRLARDLGQSQELLAALQSRQLQVVALQPQPPAQPASAWGRVLWDKDQQRWHFHASGLRPAGAGKTYELWLVTSDMRKLPAGTFDVDERGNASLTVAVPPDETMLAMAAVTDEPAGGVPQPTGSFQLVGSIP